MYSLAGAVSDQELLKARADPHRTNDAGQTAVNIARQAYEDLQTQSGKYNKPKDQDMYQTTLPVKAACLELLTSLS